LEKNFEGKRLFLNKSISNSMNAPISDSNYSDEDQFGSLIIGERRRRIRNSDFSSKNILFLFSICAQREV
jgi:hypothetical protein